MKLLLQNHCIKMDLNTIFDQMTTIAATLPPVRVLVAGVAIAFLLIAIVKSLMAPKVPSIVVDEPSGLCLLLSLENESQLASLFASFSANRRCLPSSPLLRKDDFFCGGGGGDRERERERERGGGGGKRGISEERGRRCCEGKQRTKGIAIMELARYHHSVDAKREQKKVANAYSRVCNRPPAQLDSTYARCLRRGDVSPLSYINHLLIGTMSLYRS